MVTQTADPFLAFVAEVVLIPHRFPLEFDCLGPCLRLPPTQVLDRTWQSLKTWLPPKVCAKFKVDGSSQFHPAVKQQVFQWNWRQTLGARSPGEFLADLEGLL